LSFLTGLFVRSPDLAGIDDVGFFAVGVYFAAFKQG